MTAPQTTPRYTIDPAWEGERARLAGIEALWDAGTRALLEPLVRPGARVLEVGAGGGSIARWLSAAGASVVATDLDTRFLDAAPNLEVRRHDLRVEPLEQDAFDLVHSRMLVEHLTDRPALVEKLAGALRPGGWLVVEDVDFTGFGFVDAPARLQRVVHGLIGFMALGGFDPHYGRSVTRDLAAAGLVDVRGAGRAYELDATHPGLAFFRGSLVQLGPKAVEAGLIDPADFAAAVEHIGRPDVRLVTPLLMAAVGRRPG